jgi:hypothetical protein
MMPMFPLLMKEGVGEVGNITICEFLTFCKEM